MIVMSFDNLLNNIKTISNKNSFKIYNIKRTFNKLYIGKSLKKERGLKIIVKGRLRGAIKKIKLEERKGSIKTQSLDYNVEAYNKPIYTKWGTLGIRIYRLVR